MRTVALAVIEAASITDEVDTAVNGVLQVGMIEVDAESKMPTFTFSPRNPRFHAAGASILRTPQSCTCFPPPSKYSWWSSST